MKIRRCMSLLVEPDSRIAVDLGGLLAGEVHLQPARGWQVLAAHLDQPVVLDPAQLALLAQLDGVQWQPAAQLDGAQLQALEGLLAAGVVLSDPSCNLQASQADAQVRDGYWFGLSAVYARHARWHDCDVVQAMDTPGLANARGLRELLGPAPASTIDVGDLQRTCQLPAAPPSALSRLLAQRVTCRNFCTSEPLTQGELGEVMELSFAAHGRVWAGLDMDFLKRSSPSAGGLHGVEAYVLVQRVEDLVPGWYHYRPLEHRLAPLTGVGDAAQLPTLSLLAGQQWFADAPVLVVLAARYQRVFWKYREHAKAWRALLLEAGHFSQTVYLAATQAGLGAFVTCAINEPVAEQALQVDPLQTGILAVCGFGRRGMQMTTAELDPAAAVWEPVVQPAPAAM